MMFKTNQIVTDMYAHLRKVGREKGIEFKKLELSSVAREMGLLDQIELNFPSKIVESVIHTEFPDPNHVGQSKIVPVVHESRVLMSDDEVVVYRREQAAQLLAAHYGISVEELNQLVAPVDATFGKGEKPTTKQKPSYKGAPQNPGKKTSGGAKKSSVKKPAK